MILDELARHAQKRVCEAKERISQETLKSAARSKPAGDFPFEKAISGEGVSFICEIKKASPSKGVIDPAFPYLSIAAEYEAAGADCVSCLTEPKWFLGSDEIFREIRERVSLPMLRKDFTVDEYQLYEAKCLGADAVLLIAAILDAPKIKEYLKVCDQLGLSAVVETHCAEEVRSALLAGARIVGVNCRNLSDFTVDLQNAARLRRLVPPGTLFVAESGIQSPADVAALKPFSADAILIGEALMRAADKGALLCAFQEAAK